MFKRQQLIYKWTRRVVPLEPSLPNENKAGDETNGVLETKAEAADLDSGRILPRPILAPSIPGENKAAPPLLPQYRVHWGQGGITDYLVLKDIAALAVTERRKYYLFQPESMVARSSQLSVQAKQPELKALLDRAKRSPWSELLENLMNTPSVVTDYSGRTFQQTPLTPFLAAYFYKDRHLMDLMRGSKLSLVILDKDETVPRLIEEQAQNAKTPVLIRQGETYSIYGYDHRRNNFNEKHNWAVALLLFSKQAEREKQLLQGLPFKAGEIVDCGAHLTPEVRELIKQGHPALEQYLSEEDQATQLRELRNRRVPYSLALVTLPDHFPLYDRQMLAVFRSLSIQGVNRPLLVRIKKELYFYCYDLATEDWALKPVETPELFSTLPFPDCKPLTQCGLFVLENLDQLNHIPQRESTDFVLIQKPGDAPEALYRVDGIRVAEEAKKVQFPINQNLRTFLRAVYPAVRNEHYVNIPQFSDPQLAGLIQTTGHTVAILEAGALNEAQQNELAKYHTQGTEHGLHCDDRRLEEALETYVANHALWDTLGIWHLNEYCGTAVRSAETQAAVHVANVLCRHDPFTGKEAYASETHFPRDLSFWNIVSGNKELWFPLRPAVGLLTQRISGSKQILNIVVTAGKGVSGGMGIQSFTVAFAAVHSLNRSCTQYLVTMNASLSSKKPEPQNRLDPR